MVESISTLTDRQRIELAIPAYLLYTLTGAPEVFIPTKPALIRKAESDIVALRTDLRTACLEPFADLKDAKKQALLRRLERVKRDVTVSWNDRPALSLMLMLWSFLEDLTDRGILILWDGSAMDRAVQKLMPMCELGLAAEGIGVGAQQQAQTLLRQLQGEVFYCE